LGLVAALEGYGSYGESGRRVGSSADGGRRSRGEEYGDDESRAAIDIATAIVESAYPLASLLPTLGGRPAPQGHDL
jgi:hypothetical protein